MPGLRLFEKNKMRRLLTLLAFISAPFLLHAQELSPDYKPQSRVYEFENSKCVILKRETFGMKKVSGSNEYFTLTPAVLTDVRMGESVKYLILGMEFGYTSVLDYDEIPSVIEALEYISETEKKDIPRNDVHIRMRTADALVFSADYDSALAKNYDYGVERAWRVSVVQGRYGSRPAVSFNISQVKRIIEALTVEMEFLSEK